MAETRACAVPKLFGNQNRGEIATARNANEAYHIVRMIVVGFMTHSGFRASVPAASFSVERMDERIA
jgi:hypothetical protein